MQSSNQINKIRLTDNAKSICVSTQNGFIAYSTNPLKIRFQCNFENTHFGNAVTISDSNVVVCTGVSLSTKSDSFNDCTFGVFDANLGRQIFLVCSQEQIKNVFMTSNMFGYSTKSEVRIYSFAPPVLQHQFHTSQNELAPCDFVEDTNGFTMGFVGREPGFLRIVQINKNDRQDITVPAHSHPLSIIKVNSSRKNIATASNNGTLIQVFDTKSGELIGKFRRGTLSAEITCIDFSPNSTYLAVASSKGTIHLFSLLNMSGPSNTPRAIMKFSFPELGNSPFCFMSSDTICTALKNGTIHMLKIDEENKSISIVSSESFVDLSNGNAKN